MLEDVAVPAADAGVLGHVDDAQLAARRCARRARRRTSPQRSQKTRWEARSRSPTSVPRVTDSWWSRHARREVEDAEARPARRAGTVDVLVGHRVALVEQADPLDQLARDVHAGAGHRQHGPGTRGRPPVAGLEAVAVVEPLGRAAGCARCPANWMRPSGYSSLAPTIADVVLLGGGVLQARQPAAAGLDVGVEHDDVAARIARRAGRG